MIVQLLITLETDLARRPLPSELYTFFDLKASRAFFWTTKYPIRPRERDIRWNVYGAHIGRMKLWNAWFSIGNDIDFAKFHREMSWFYGVGKSLRHVKDYHPNDIWAPDKRSRYGIDFEPPFMGDWLNYQMPFRSIIDNDYFPQRKSTIHHRREIVRVHSKFYRNTMWSGAVQGQIYLTHTLPHASYISSRLIFGDLPVRISTRWLNYYGVLERNYFWPFRGAVRNKIVRNLNYAYTDTLLPTRLQTRNSHVFLFQATPLWENYLNSLFVQHARLLVQSNIDKQDFNDYFIFKVFFLIVKYFFSFFFAFNWSLFYFWWFFLFFPVICLTNFRYIYLARLQSELLTYSLPEQPIKRGGSSSTLVLPSLTSFDTLFYQKLWLRLENLYSRPNRRLDRRYDFYDIVEFKGAKSYRSRKTSLSRTTPTIKHRFRPRRRYFLHNDNQLIQDNLSSLFPVNQSVNRTIRPSRLLYDQMLDSANFRKQSFFHNSSTIFERLLKKTNSSGWLARPVQIDHIPFPTYSLMRQPEANETILRTSGYKRSARHRRKRSFDLRRRAYKKNAY